MLKESSNNTDDNGKTQLHWAALSNDTKTAQLLINNKANIEAKDEDDETPLHYSVRFHHLETTQLLIDNGANINAKNKHGKTPLDIAKEHIKIYYNNTSHKIMVPDDYK